jgi:hypothetical protein
MDPKPAEGASAEEVLELQWEEQRRRRTWMTLAVWDVHMACVLGRPTTTDLSIDPPTLPVDALDPTEPRRTPVVPRAEGDPPTPLTRAIVCRV